MFKKGYIPWNKGTGRKVILICAICKKIIYRYSSQLLNREGRDCYCSKECYGKWLGRTHGKQALERFRQSL